MISILGALLMLVAPAQEAESIFDGKTLEKWDGNPKFWKVEDGAITGQTTAENPTKGNTFIVWRGGETENFELTLEYKIVGGNSGVQYRSFEVPNEKWVIGGYQADLADDNEWSGALYGERFRGILAKRGQKTVIGEDGKPKETGKVGDSAEIQAKIKKGDWNTYSISAKGNHFVHKINDVVTIDSTDEDVKGRRASGLLALQLHAGPPMKVQFKNIRLKKLAASGKAPDKGASNPAGKKVVFVAGKASHGKGSHEHRSGCTLLARKLTESMPGWSATVTTDGWPQDETLFNGADALVFYGDGGGGHFAIPHVGKIDAMMKKGVGLACIHYAVEVPKGAAGDKWLEWIGGYFEANWSVNPHWTAEFKLPDHPIARGVASFKINDEWYYHMRFRPEMKGVTPILSAVPEPKTVGKDGSHSGNPAAREAVAKGEPQHVAWAAERPDGGRGFGFTGGHVHANWKDDNHRKVMLNAIVWVAKGEVPKEGVASKTPGDEELDAFMAHHGDLKEKVFAYPPATK